MNINFDVDIDLADRDKLLKLIPHICARSEKNKNKKHQSGIYLQPIPVDPMTNIATIDFNDAEEMNYFKIDILNNSIYEGIRDEEHLESLMKEPVWELLTYLEIVEQLSHVNRHTALLQEYKPTSVVELAMVISLIRPAKKHLRGKSYSEIENEIWKKPTNGEYYYKKSHAISYAMSIVVELNHMMELGS